MKGLYRTVQQAEIALRAKDAEIKKLRAALEPFARNVDAVSLSETLGHITREDLWRALAAMQCHGEKPR